MILIKRKKLFGSIVGITIWPFIVVTTDSKVTLNHEKIHIEQQKELLVIPFYLWYFVEWLFKGYGGISFEKEAYDNERDISYLKNRGRFSFIKYLKRSKK